MRGHADRARSACPPAGIDVAIVDPATGERVPAGASSTSDGRLLNADEAIGEIVGRNVVGRFEGYYNNPEADAPSAPATAGTGRATSATATTTASSTSPAATADWLRVDGENFAAAPVERIIERFPGVAGVAVYGVPDDRTADDQVMAAIELAAGDRVRPVPRSTRSSTDAARPRHQVGAALRARRRTPPGRPPPTRSTRRRCAGSAGSTGDDPVYWRPGPDATPHADDRRRPGRAAAAIRRARAGRRRRGRSLVTTTPTRSTSTRHARVLPPARLLRHPGPAAGRVPGPRAVARHQARLPATTTSATISRDPERFCSGRGVLVNDPLREGGNVDGSILHMDPPQPQRVAPHPQPRVHQHGR